MFCYININLCLSQIICLFAINNNICLSVYQ